MPIKGMSHGNPKPKHMAVRNRAPIVATEINKTNRHSKSLQCPSIICNKCLKDDSHGITRAQKKDSTHTIIIAHKAVVS